MQSFAWLKPAHMMVNSGTFTTRPVAGDSSNLWGKVKTTLNITGAGASKKTMHYWKRSSPTCPSAAAKMGS